MSRTPDRSPGAIEEDEGAFFTPQATHPTVNGELRYVSGAGFRFFDEGVEKSLATSAADALHKEVLDVSIPQGYSEAFGTVSGLSATPTAVVSQSIYERDAGVAQSGLAYTFNAYELTSNGFKYRLAIVNDDFWPGPGPVTVRITYLWSNA